MSDLLYNEKTGQYGRMTDSGKIQIVPDYAAETGEIDAALINAGETIANVPRHLGNMGKGLLNLMGGDFEYDQPDMDTARYMDALQQESPVASTVGDILPYLATAPLGMTAAATKGILPNLGIATGIGAGTGALFEGAEGILPGAIGGLGGDLFGRALGRAWNGVMGARKAAPTTKMAQLYEDTGGKLTPGARTGDQGLQIIDQKLQTNAMTSGAMQKVGKENQENLNNLVIRALDQGDDITLDPGGLQILDERIGRQFQELGDLIPPTRITGRTIQEIDEIAPSVKHLQFAELDDAIKTGRRSIDAGDYRPQTRGAPGMRVTEPEYPDAVLTGEQLMAVRSEITSALDNAKTAAETRRFGRLLDRVDEQIGENAGEEANAIYTSLRDKFRLKETLKSGQLLSGEGDVSQKLLRNRLQQTYGSSYPQVLSGQSEAAGRLAENVRAGTSKEMTAPFGRPGTAESLPFSPSGLAQGLLGKAYMNSGGRAAGVISGLSNRSPGSPVGIMRALGEGTFNEALE